MKRYETTLAVIERYEGLKRSTYGLQDHDNRRLLANGHLRWKQV